MFARHRHSRGLPGPGIAHAIGPVSGFPDAPRRGIVLVLVLALLGLMAVIGVTFATFSGQAQVGARQYAQSRLAPEPDELFDFALAQLINDTDNPTSAIRGHSLLRDMYGNDSVSRGSSSAFGDRLAQLPYLGVPVLNYQPLRFIDTRLHPDPVLAAQNFFQVCTNIPAGDQANGATAGLDFTGWIVRITGSNVDPNTGNPVPAVAQTFEVVGDAIVEPNNWNVDSGKPNGQNTGLRMHWFTLSPYSLGKSAPRYPTGVGLANPFTDSGPGSVNPYVTFTLDGRFLRAFNGSGIAASGIRNRNNPNVVDVLRPSNAISAEPNFLFNGVGNPGNFGTNFGFTLGMPDNVPADESYDACDLENWYLAIQSADGRVVIPSFHRPGVIRAWDDLRTPGIDTDWTNQNGTLLAADANFPYTIDSRARILRPRKVDMGPGFPNDPTLNPDGTVTYDVDNDGDGITDAVWLDLGHPVLRDSSGKLYKPLYAITVLGLNGRLPLNTAGNLQGRAYEDDPTTASVNEFGMPTFDHTSHVGASTNEINPQYAFRDPLIIGTGDTTFQIDQLRRLLTGDFHNGSPVAGLWGEPQLLDANWSVRPNFPGHAILPGRSSPSVIDPNIAARYPDGRLDAEFDANDFFNLAISGIGNYEYSDQTDAAGALMIPAERIRRFLTPIDPVGTGRVMGYNRPVPGWDPAHAPDANMDGEPDDIDGDGKPDGIALGFPARFDYGTGFDNRGRSSFFHHFRPAGLPPGPDPTVAPVVNGFVVNRLHGYESHRDPLLRSENNFPYYYRGDPRFWEKNRVFVAAMPNNLNAGMSAPTYDFTINAPYLDIDPAGISAYPRGTAPFLSGGLNWGEADQLNLYNPGQYDTPFNYPDLEWLYRNQDVDGSSLDSRLSRLGPFYVDVSGVSRRFFDPATPRHNRLFSVDVWETTSFAWANDNPGGVFNFNSRFNSAGSASLGGALLGPTPPVAQRDRKINLNYPLPVSNDPFEPVRLKWISDTYTFLKAVLPPKAVDHPEELAKLGQFVVNIIDFRDTDDTITIWTNPDVRLTAATATESPRVVFASEPTAVDPLIHYGMEYLPVAIDEVLAYSFRWKDPNGTGTNGTPIGRFFLELTNTLTRANSIPASGMDLAHWDIMITREDSSDTGFARPSPVTGQLVEDNGSSTRKTAPLSGPVGGDESLIKPDGTATRVPSLDEAGRRSHFVIGYQPPEGINKPLEPKGDGDGLDMDKDGKVTLDAILRDPDSPDQEGTVTDILDVPPPVDTSGGNGLYHWVYLRRPANPDLPSDPTTNPMVVVDSMRFPYCESGGTIDASQNPPKVTQGAQRLWSVQRRQPYRGGQAVPNGENAPELAANAPTAKYSPATAYGFSEQSSYSSGGNENEAHFGVFDPLLNDPHDDDNRVTRAIQQTLRSSNAGNEAWDPFVFHDRDFQSVAELMLVPACPPGLFTKQFVEDDDDPLNPLIQTVAGTAAIRAFDTLADQWDIQYASTTTHAGYATPPEDQPNGPFKEGTALNRNPHLYPYLADEFFYSGYGHQTGSNIHDPLDDDDDANWLTVNPNRRAGGRTSTGWHKMLGIFEVPTSSFGAIGPVSSGHNFDWLREDIRPGQVNINLIIDEEVFFGVLDDPRMDYSVPQLAMPQVVTMVDLTGQPTATPQGYYPMFDPIEGSDGRGFFYRDERGQAPDNSGMKTAFYTFLTLRHGGLLGNVPQLFGPNPERPFHDLTYPDINFTLMRPAELPDPTETPPSDPGVKPIQPDPNIEPTAPQPPSVPPRRLFELPTALPPGTNNTSLVDGNALTVGANLFDQNPRNDVVDGTPPDENYSNPPFRYSLGGNTIFGTDTDGNDNAEDDIVDRRAHPYFRTELLQKLMNLTTVRTHQYAVWVTVGYFEVLKPGNPAMAATDPAAAVDILGGEIGLASGRSKRLRMFAILDRTRATGFNPRNPGDFRDVVVYRRRIE